ncbi:MAG TPA: DUF6448 family protein [candidate division Zixibacteria bacterium]|nr:DUF6448 family protein [candidate division Zixibacteria bacterium]
MKKVQAKKIAGVLAFVLALTFVMSGMARAHCDGLDGPVVKAAQKALDSKNVNFALIWVQKENEPEIKAAFQKTLSVRKLNPEAKELVDRYFFETLVRLHRAGEGAPYTGLKPAGRDLGPAIPAADGALEKASVEELQKLLHDALREGIERHFKEALVKKNYQPEDVEAGREYVRAYVEFMHYVEGLFETASGTAESHSEDHLEAGHADK